MRITKNKELILVTGGAGFIGGHLVDAFIDDGFAVRVMDNLAPPSHNGKAPKWLNKKAELMKGDVRNKKDWIKALMGVSYVFHEAGYMDFHMDFSTYFDTNATSAALMYEVIAEKKYPIKKVIAASSQYVYGEGKYECKTHGIIYPELRGAAQLEKKDWEVRCPKCGEAMKPLPELETDMLRPINSYSESKKTLENILFALGRYLNIPSVALRYCIVHGPRQSFKNFYSGVLRQFSVMALTSGVITMHEDGRQLRDFVHIQDVVSANLAVLKSSQADFQTFIVGSGTPTRVIDLAERVAGECGVPFKYELPGLYRVATARHSMADVSKLKSIGWRPRHNIGNNVHDYVAWIKQYPEAKEYLASALSQLQRSRVVKRAGRGSRG